MTVLQALAMAQGATGTASLDSAKLIRTTDGKQQETPVPLKRILASKSPGSEAPAGRYFVRPQQRRQICCTPQSGSHRASSYWPRRLRRAILLTFSIDLDRRKFSWFAWILLASAIRIGREECAARING